MYKETRYPDAFSVNLKLSEFNVIIIDAMFVIYHPPLRSYNTFAEYLQHVLLGIFYVIMVMELKLCIFVLMNSYWNLSHQRNWKDQEEILINLKTPLSKTLS